MSYEVVAVGGSLGGAEALAELLAGLTGDFDAPVVATLHRGPDPGPALVRKLQSACALPVAEPDDKEPLKRGRVYLAPAGYHLQLDQRHLALSAEGPVSLAIPSIDVLFESAADAWGSQVIGVLLSGASSDGAAGLASIKARGGMALVQDPATARARLMPEAALKAARVDQVLPVAQIALLLVRLCGRR